MMEIIHESSKSKKTYKCPYCDFRAVKEKLIHHIDSKHDDMIPENFTPARIVFNIINKKEYGTCIECKRETRWNEEKCRYERLCDDPKCHVSYKKKVEERIKRIYGKSSRELLLDPNQQTKMLANRRISGTYKWADGTVFTYTGEYERKALEFCESFGFSSSDIITPGAVIKYQYGGKEHMWITDIWIVPYNLLIDCKDGGDNPNNRPMKEYREKQIAKEKAIAADGRYNYLRLTNNNFKQLIEVLTILKLQLLEDNRDERIIKINEAMFADIGGFIPPANIDNVYIVNYMKKNMFAPDIALTNDIKLQNLIIRNEDGILTKVDNSFLDDAKYNIYRYDNDNIDLTELKENMNKYVSKYFIHEVVFNKKYYTDDQFLTEDIIEIPDINAYYESIQSIVEASLLYDKDDIKIPSMEPSVYGDRNGNIFMMNETYGIRTRSSKNIEDFSILEKNIIKRGYLI